MATQLTEKQRQDGWQIVRFGEIAKEVKQSTKTALADGLKFYVGLEHLDPQSLRIERKGVIAEDNPSFTRVFKAGHILFGKRRCYQKKAAVVDFHGICSGDIIVIEAIEGKMIPELLPFIVQSDMFFEWAEKTSSGSLSPRTKWKALAEFEIRLPPLERQKEIINVLQTLEEAIRKGEKLENSAQILFKSTSIFHLNIVSQQKVSNNKIPCGWGIKTLSEIAKVDRGKFTPRPRNNPIYYGGKYPFVQTADVKNSGGFIKEHSQTLNDKGLAVSRMFPKGSILITIAANIGEVAITTYDTACTDSVVAIQPNDNIDSNWLLFYLMQLQPYLDSVATESAQKNINLQVLRPLKIAVPPFSEQIKLSATLLKLFKLQRSSVAVGSKINLRRLLMMRYFKGAK